MQHYKILNVADCDNLFTPGPKDRLWIFEKHYENLVRSLFGRGSRDEITEAVCGAIAKCLGDHPTCKLEEPLENVSEEELCRAIYWQACGMLSHLHEREDRLPLHRYHTFAEVQQAINDILEDTTMSENARQRKLGGLRRLMDIMVLASVGENGGGVVIPRCDRTIVRSELLRIVRELFRQHHIKKGRARAFLDAFFTEKSSKERAAENGMTVSDTDTSKNQLLKFLKKHGSAFRESSILTDYFPFIMAA